MNMGRIYSTLACNLDSHILLASLPLFESGRVEAIEWAFDTLYKIPGIPAWFYELLGLYSAEGRLLGHGVYFSLFAGKWSADQQRWLDRLRERCGQFHFDHISEHFGFMSGGDFHTGAPFSVPYTPASLALGRDRLQRLQDTCGRPVGLENLAYAYAPQEVYRQGEFLEKLLQPVNGFIILDLHNLYCQMHNFGIGADALIACYPLQRVREIHLSGGSWQASEAVPGRQVRRDTHDQAVPEEVFQWLQDTIALCPNLKYVVLEQLGAGLRSESARLQFQADFYRMDEIVQAANLPGTRSEKEAYSFLPIQKPQAPSLPLEDLTLAGQQRELSALLEDSPDFAQLQAGLLRSSLAQSAWEVEHWEPHMLETGREIARKWKHGFQNKPA